MDKIEKLLTRGIANIIPNIEELKKTLSSGKKLNIYLGIDPTATRIHLGHGVILRKLNEFARLGHNVTFLIGDFTALIGDASDKDKERPVLTSEEIKKNFQTYKEQAQKILDFSKVKVRFNSEWLNKLDTKKFIQLCIKFSLNDFISRELIRKRLEMRTRVGLHEVLYPALQGYDSYFLDTDIQIGGTDQTFNMQAGRTLQKLWRNKESFIVATEFLTGIDGRKMSKSWNNAIWLDDSPNDMFAKVMAIKDDLIIPYFKLATTLPMNAVNKMGHDLKTGQHPMHIKSLLANQIVLELHGPEAAKNAQEHFKKSVQQKSIPIQTIVTSIPRSQAINISIDHFLYNSGVSGTVTEGRRLTTQGGIVLNGKKITNPNQIISKEQIDKGIIKMHKGKLKQYEIHITDK